MIDFDFGFDGRTGGFDEYWLGEFAEHHLSVSPSTFNAELGFAAPSTPLSRREKRRASSLLSKMICTTASSAPMSGYSTNAEADNLAAGS